MTSGELSKTSRWNTREKQEMQDQRNETKTLQWLKKK
jgi:hypothetical protein